MLTATKISSSAISVEKTIPETKVTQTYHLGFLQKQLKDIQAQKDAYAADRDREIAEVEELIALAEEEGCVVAEEEVVSEQLPPSP